MLQFSDFTINTGFPVRVLVVIPRQLVAGYCVFHLGPSLRAVTIDKLVVEPSWRGYGLGSKLLHGVIDITRRAGRSRIRYVADPSVTSLPFPCFRREHSVEGGVLYSFDWR